MTDEVARYSFHINSAYRNSGTSTDMNIQLSQLIGLIAKGTMFQVIVHGITIPFSFYQLSSDIQTVSIRVVNGANTYNGTIGLTPGNYNVNTVNAELQAKVIAYILSVTTISAAVTVAYNTTTSKTTMSITNAMTVTLFFSSNTSLGLFFGFSGNAVFSNLSSATGDKVAVANPVNTLYLRSPTLKQFKNREWQTEKDVFSDILYRIPIYTQQNTYIQQYQESEPIWIVNNIISSMNFYLSTNLSYTPINLQGLDIQFHFTIIEKDQHVFESIVATTLTNRIEPPKLEQDQEIVDLEKQRDQLLKRIETYKSKLGEA